MGHSKTFDVDKQTGESGATAHAMYTGAKTIHDTMGFDTTIRNDDINTMLTSEEVDGIVTWAQESGMSTGLVTTARLTHATPAAAYAHTFYRHLE